MEKLSKYFSINLISFIVGCLLILFLTKSATNIDIKQLKKQNDSLIVENHKLSKINDSIRNVIDKTDLVIEKLSVKDSSLKIKVGQLDNKIQSLKYEAANNYANNFGSLDIQRYFAELK